MKAQPTTELVQPLIDPSLSPKEVLKGSKGSAAGYSAVSQWQTCPERSRLYALGVRLAQDPDLSLASYDEDVSARAFGTLVHHCRAVRFVHGIATLEAMLIQSWKHQLPTETYAKLLAVFRIYEAMFPLAQEPMQILGVEVDVLTDIAEQVGATKPVIKTVRYDTVAYAPGVPGAPPELFSFEAKTMSRGGNGALSAYMGQAMTHVAVWNGNAALVAKYGKMRGVLFDCIVKTQTPNIERRGPFYFGAPHMKLTYRYLAQADTGDVTYRVQDDGKFPRMLHSCWGRWAPCEYIGACHEEAYGAYEYKSGEPYDGR